jgi:hypothetical protein
MLESAPPERLACPTQDRRCRRTAQPSARWPTQVAQQRSFSLRADPPSRKNRLARQSKSNLDQLSMPAIAPPGPVCVGFRGTSLLPLASFPMPPLTVQNSTKLTQYRKACYLSTNLSPQKGRRWEYPVPALAKSLASAYCCRNTVSEQQRSAAYARHVCSQQTRSASSPLLPRMPCGCSSPH